MENNKEYKEHLAQVKDWGENLKWVPEEYKTKELCEVAVKSIGHALAYVPKELKSPELCELAIKGVLGQGGNLKFVPYELQTQELCELAVKDKGYALEHVPEELKTLEMCDVAVDLFIINSEKYTFTVSEMIEAVVPEEFKEELAEKYDIELPKKTNERGR